MTCVICGNHVHGRACYTCGTPVRAPILSAYARVRRLRGLGYAAAAAVGVTLLLGSAGRLFPLVDGVLTGRAGDIDPSALNRAALLSARTDIAYAVAFLPAGALVIAWLYLARRNLDSFVGARATLRPAWAIGSWFIPLVNLAYPCRIMADVARACLFRTRIGLLVGVWWTGWLGAAVADAFVRRWEESAYRALPTDLAGSADLAAYAAYYEGALLHNAPVALLTAASGVALMVLISRISRAQDRRIMMGRALDGATAEFAYAGHRQPAAASRVAG